LNNEILTVTYISPGWPLNNFPNGIVAYIDNLMAGFDSSVRAQILAREVIGEMLSESIIDLSQLTERKSIINKLSDRVLNKIGYQYIENLLEQGRANEASKRIIKGLELQEYSSNLIEMEESFGLAKWVVPKTRVPVVTRLHGPWFVHGPIMQFNNDNNDKFRIKIEGEAIILSQGVTAPSLDVLEKVREYYDVPLPDAKVIPNSVPPVVKSQQWQYKAKNKQTILMVGRFDLHKGGDLALDAFRIIARENKDIDFLFVGPDRGVIVEGKEYLFNQYLAAFIPEAEITSRIQFLGHCSSDKVQRLRRNSTVTIMTSRYDNFPVSLLEAMAVGSPLVGSSVGGIKEIIIDGYNGLLAEPESADSIAECALTLLNDVELMKKLSANAIVDSKNRFSPEVVAKQSLDFYKSVLSK